VHHVFVREVGVGEDDLVDAVHVDEPRELGLRPDRDAVGVPGAGERRRIPTVVDPRDLRRGERDDLGLRIVPEDDVEVVEVASAGAHDDDFVHRISFHLMPAGSR
jgi:hypothetical protein